MKNSPYIGNGAYCYANSTAMLLASIGENTAPSQIEVLSGVGLGAHIQRESGLIFFNDLAGWPDVGISTALNILGFSFKEEAGKEPEPAPFGELREVLERSPAVLGPLDVNHLLYNPKRPKVAGVDHYVLAISMDDEKVYLHDPAGFPYVSLPLEQLKLAWKAESIFYRRDYYRYWTSPKRVRRPTEEEIYNQALQLFKSIYQESAVKSKEKQNTNGPKVILACAKRMQNKEASEDEIGQLTHFALPLGARRALDFASFFDSRDADLASLKRRQARLFGESHTFAVAEDWSSSAKKLQELAEVEEEFRTKLLGSREKDRTN